MVDPSVTSFGKRSDQGLAFELSYAYRRGWEDQIRRRHRGKDPAFSEHATRPDMRAAYDLAVARVRRR